MDVFSHWLWSMAITRKKISWKVSGPMGVLPDLLAFIPASIYRMANGIPRQSVDDDTVTSDMPFAWEIYQWTHSLTIVAFLVWLRLLFTSLKGSRAPRIYGRNICSTLVIPHPNRHTRPHTEILSNSSVSPLE